MDINIHELHIWRVTSHTTMWKDEFLPRWVPDQHTGLVSGPDALFYPYWYNGWYQSLITEVKYCSVIHHKFDLHRKLRPMLPGQPRSVLSIFPNKAETKVLSIIRPDLASLPTVGRGRTRQAKPWHPSLHTDWLYAYNVYVSDTHFRTTLV